MIECELKEKGVSWELKWALPKRPNGELNNGFFYRVRIGDNYFDIPPVPHSIVAKVIKRRAIELGLIDAF